MGDKLNAGLKCERESSELIITVRDVSLTVMIITTGLVRVVKPGIVLAATHNLK